MSLQLAAQHMASRGRGPDTTLVHMAPQEVAGLQALAKAHGGTLTVNPDTGLPEAGVLSNILPMVIGAGITAATGGAAAPWMIGLGVGGAQTLATGSLQKGLMAGLGAYGGAGLAGGLMGAGAASTGLSALDAGMGVMPTGTIGAAQTLAPSALDAGMGAMPTGSIGASALDAGMGTYPTANLAAAPKAVSPFQPMPSPVQTVTQAPTLSQNVSQMGRGIQNLGTEAGRSAFMSKEGVGGGSGLLKYGYAAAAPLLMQGPEKQAEKPKEMPYEYAFDYGRAADPQAGYTGAFTGERTYFNPVYTRTAAGGGLMDIGPIQSMSDRNQAETMMANGGTRFAEGGETKAVQPVEQDPYYTMTGQSGDAFKYLMGQGQRPAAAPAPVMAPVAAAAPVYEDRPGGEWVDDTSNLIKSYTFDPITGGFTPAAAPKVWRAFAPAGMAGDYGGGGVGGYDGGVGGYGGDYGAGFAAASASDFGGSDGGGYGGGGGDTSGGYGGDAGYGAANGGLMQQRMAMGGISALARGGQSHLGDYSDGGRLLKGPGDGVSDSIPATIANKRPARLADGEFVVPARIVSELGNGSTEAGARKLYAMMDRVQKARKKSIGKNRVAVNSRAEKLLPA